MMELLKEQVAILQKDAQNILTRLDALYETNSKSKVLLKEQSTITCGKLKVCV